MAVEPQAELLSSLQRLFVGGLYSDLLIVCGDDRYQVHRAIVCPRSQFFATACNGVFKEGNTGIIYLNDDDPLAVRLMIHYLYHLDYPHQDDNAAHSILPDTETASLTFSAPDSSNSAPRKKGKKAKKAQMFGIDSIKLSNLTIHAKVYALAEKYDIQSLKSTALEKFKGDAELSWMSPDFLRASEEVYTSTIVQDRAMRDVVLETFAKHPSLLDTEVAQNTVRSLDLCYDLMMRFRARSMPAKSPFETANWL